MANDHTRSAENWNCVWYLLRLYIYIYRVYVDSHSLGQLALASKRTASTPNINIDKIHTHSLHGFLNDIKVFISGNCEDHSHFSNCCIGVYVNLEIYVRLILLQY